MRRGEKQLLYLLVLELRTYDYWWWRYGKAIGGRIGGFRTIRLVAGGKQGRPVGCGRVLLWRYLAQNSGHLSTVTLGLLLRLEAFGSAIALRQMGSLYR
jgi:hypothetical protein